MKRLVPLLYFERGAGEIVMAEVRVHAVASGFAGAAESSEKRATRERLGEGTG